MTYKETIKAYAVYADISYAEAARRADVLMNFIIDTPFCVVFRLLSNRPQNSICFRPAESGRYAVFGCNSVQTDLSAG